MAGSKVVTAVVTLVVMEAAQVVTEAVMAAVVPVPGVHLIHQHDLQHLPVVVLATLAVSMAVAGEVVVEAVAVVLVVEDMKVNFNLSSPLIGQPIRN